MARSHKKKKPTASCSSSSSANPPAPQPQPQLQPPKPEQPTPSGISLADYDSTPEPPGRMTRNRKRLAEGKEVQKPRYRFVTGRHSVVERPRWYNQTYILFLALKELGNGPVPRGQLIPKALELDKRIAEEKGLPPLFGGKTPQNTASGILTENRDKMFISFIPDGKRHVHFKLAFEPGNVETSLALYKKWLDDLITVHWPYLFSKRRAEYDARRKAELRVAKMGPRTGGGGGEASPQPADAGSNGVAKRPLEEDKENTSTPKPVSKKARTETSSSPNDTPVHGHAIPIISDDAQPTTGTTGAATDDRKTFEDWYPGFEFAEDDCIPTSLHDILDVRVSTIPNAGRGAFAKRFIPARTEIGFYFGVPRTEDEFDMLKGHLPLPNHYAHRYRLTVIDATNDAGIPYGDDPAYFCPFHYVNEDPARANLAYDRGAEVNQIVCVATRDVQEGEELFGDYGTEIERFWGVGEGGEKQGTNGVKGAGDGDDCGCAKEVKMKREWGGTDGEEGVREGDVRDETDPDPPTTSEDGNPTTEHAHSTPPPPPPPQPASTVAASPTSPTAKPSPALTSTSHTPQSVLEGQARGPASVDGKSVGDGTWE
ncbi:uncharacterized protein EV422DRAFT_583031 [Fimicolochytrium jonesii]|uniref:uncharacterized protein n=1 Tax=Fimicolochytrium jonesii TaxID=1396493 RepID=UPI0022FE41AD|nr:uncharacterized protein EV422DRAFT_583031 [Fimicolochytrium jonesii]KAI8825609.1 hypothetical protein EV422DRAFT_583031 [Fimicolochytrium jonesii]